jgi:hypothetical protein
MEPAAFSRFFFMIFGVIFVISIKIRYNMIFIAIRFLNYRFQNIENFYAQ